MKDHLYIFLLTSTSKFILVLLYLSSGSFFSSAPTVHFLNDIVPQKSISPQCYFPPAISSQGPGPKAVCILTLLNLQATEEFYKRVWQSGSLILNCRECVLKISSNFSASRKFSLINSSSSNVPSTSLLLLIILIILISTRLAVIVIIANNY